jgi:heme exporter protein C
MYALLILVLVTTGLYHAIPHSSNIGAVQRIAGFQLALSFCAIACFFANFVASIRFLQRHRRSSDALAVAAAEVGLLLCGVLLVTGAVSSYRLMGVWWTWSTSGTAALLLGFVYASYLILRRYANAGQRSTLAAVLGIFAFADIPLMYVSVAMRNAAGHLAAPDLAPSIAYRQLVESSIVFSLLAAAAVGVRFRKERVRQEADDREAFAAH